MIIHTFSVFTLSDVVFLFHFNLHLLQKPLQIRIHHFSKTLISISTLPKIPSELLKLVHKDRTLSFIPKKSRTFASYRILRGLCNKTRVQYFVVGRHEDKLEEVMSHCAIETTLGLNVRVRGKVCSFGMEH